MNIKLKEIHDKFHTNKDVKNTMSRDPEASVHSSAKKQKTMDARFKNKLSKRESVFFKPTEKDNKVLGELILKVPVADRESAGEAAVQDQHHTVQQHRQHVEAAHHQVAVCRRHGRGHSQRVGARLSREKGAASARGHRAAEPAGQQAHSDDRQSRADGRKKAEKDEE